MARPATWPTLDSIKEAYVSIAVYNSRADIDAPAKSTLDALEGVLFDNDRVVLSLTLHRRKGSHPKPYIEVEVEIP